MNDQDEDEEESSNCGDDDDISGVSHINYKKLDQM